MIVSRNISRLTNREIAAVGGAKVTVNKAKMADKAMNAASWGSGAKNEGIGSA